MKLKGAVALVTGANRGLGKALTQALLSAGVKKVYGGARNPKSISVPGVIPVQLDVTKPEQVQAAARALGDVSIVINNAGIFQGSTLASDDLFALARESMETNYFGPVAVAKAFAPILAANSGGALVCVLSVAAWTSVPGYLPYGPSKAAALMFTTAIRDELKAQGTQVTAILAGPIDTEMVADLDLPIPKTNPDTLARIVVEGIEAGKQEILTDDFAKMIKGQLSVELPLFGK